MTGPPLSEEPIGWAVAGAADPGGAARVELDPVRHVVLVQGEQPLPELRQVRVRGPVGGRPRWCRPCWRPCAKSLDDNLFSRFI